MLSNDHNVLNAMLNRFNIYIFKCVTILRYAWSRRRRRRIILGLGTRMGSTLIFYNRAVLRHKTNNEITHFHLLVQLQQLAKRSDRQESHYKRVVCF